MIVQFDSVHVPVNVTRGYQFPVRRRCQNPVTTPTLLLFFEVVSNLELEDYNVILPRLTSHGLRGRRAVIAVP